MKKIKMARGTTLTFEEGCDKYLEYCRQRNLRQGTINHYKQSYTQFFKYFDPQMPIEDIDEQTYRVIHERTVFKNTAYLERDMPYSSRKVVLSSSYCFPSSVYCPEPSSSMMGFASAQ